MSYTEDSTDLDWKESKPKVKYLKRDLSFSKPKYSQKFCEKWMEIFHPWLARCDDDINKPFCRACQTRLDCNRCHLQRHERTTKHQRNLEILINKGEGAARQNLSIRRERSKYYQQRIKNSSVESSQDASDNAMDTLDEYIEEADADTFQFVQTDDGPDLYNQTPDITQLKQEIDCKITAKNGLTKNIVGGKTTSASSRKPVKKDRMKLLMQIQKDKNDLMESFKDLIIPSPPKEKNHVDLFFESVSSSVKALSPKLIAESKMRVSQLICELELRALTEQDSTVGSANAVVVSPDSNNSYIVHETLT